MQQENDRLPIWTMWHESQAQNNTLKQQESTSSTITNLDHKHDSESNQEHSINAREAVGEAMEVAPTDRMTNIVDQQQLGQVRWTC